jgi:hypothetical protein
MKVPDIRYKNHRNWPKTFRLVYDCVGVRCVLMDLELFADIVADPTRPRGSTRGPWPALHARFSVITGGTTNVALALQVKPATLSIIVSNTCKPTHSTGRPSLVTLEELTKVESFIKRCEETGNCAMCRVVTSF